MGVKDTFVSDRPAKALTAAVVAFLNASTRAGDLSADEGRDSFSEGGRDAIAAGYVTRLLERQNPVILRQNNADSIPPRQAVPFRHTC